MLVKQKTIDEACVLQSEAKWKSLCEQTTQKYNELLKVILDLLSFLTNFKKTSKGSCIPWPKSSPEDKSSRTHKTLEASLSPK